MINKSSSTTSPIDRAPTGSIDSGMLLVALIWGANFVVVKSSFAQIPPLAFAALRYVLASLALALLLRWREGLSPLPPGSFRRIVWLGLIGNTGYQALFVIGLSMTTAANSSMLLSTTPALVALFGGLLGIEKINRRTASGIAMATSGIALVMLARGASFSMSTVLGDLITLASVLCWVTYVLGVRTLTGKISSLRLTALTMLAGTPGLLLLGGTQMMKLDWAAFSPTTWFGVFYASMLALVVSYLLYNRAVARIGSVRTSVHGCIIPVVAALIAWPVLGERPTLWQGAGAALIIGGVLLTRGKKETAKSAK